jgi:hypothetical protein
MWLEQQVTVRFDADQLGVIPVTQSPASGAQNCVHTEKEKESPQLVQNSFGAFSILGYLPTHPLTHCLVPPASARKRKWQAL